MAVDLEANAKKRYRILEADYRLSVHQLKDLPSPLLPEAAFVGRSNSGKSTLLNALCEKRALARTSKTPGRTQALNFFDIQFRDESEEALDKHQALFVDLPGFGYAQVPGDMRRKWKNLIESYLFERKSLRTVLLLQDSRRDPGEEERWIAELGRDGGLIVALTKTDKLKKNDVLKRRRFIVDQLGVDSSQVFLTGVGGKKTKGVEQLRQAILSSLIA